MTDYKLQMANWPLGLKRVVIAFLLTMSIGVTLGIGMVWMSTTATADGIVKHYRGDDPAEIEFIPEKYPMPVKELLNTTHNHVLSFTMIFGALGVLLQFTSRLSARWKAFFSVEPFVSIVTTFGSMWGIRFVHDGFVWLMFLSSFCLYMSFYAIMLLIVRELLPVRANTEGHEDGS